MECHFLVKVLFTVLLILSTTGLRVSADKNEDNQGLGILRPRRRKYKQNLFFSFRGTLEDLGRGESSKQKGGGGGGGTGVHVFVVTFLNVSGNKT